MPINTKTDYIEIGTSVNNDKSLNNVLLLPAPHGLPFTNEFISSAERNANGTMLLQQVGRTQFKTTISWEILKNKKWWEVNRWFDRFGYVFWLKYFNHSDGKIKIQRFYRGNQNQATPSSDTEILNGVVVPKNYHNCGFSIIDMGETSVYIVKEVNIS